MVRLDIRDDRQHRRKAQERAVILVGLDDDDVALADDGIRAEDRHFASDDDGRIETALGYDEPRHGRRSRLAVRAGDADAELHPHELAQHHRARNDRNAQMLGLLRFGILPRLNRGRVDDHVGVAHIVGLMTLVDGRAERFEPFCDFRTLQIRSGHMVAPVEEHLGDRTHADSADAHHVDAADATQRWLPSAFGHENG